MYGIRRSGDQEEEGDTVADESEANGDEPRPRTLESLSADRRKKREVLAGQGIDPYPLRFDRTATAAELHQRHDGLDPDVRTGEHGADGRPADQHPGARQALVRHPPGCDRFDPTPHAGVHALRTGQAGSGQRRPGDWIGAEGEAVTSRRGELSVDVNELWLLSKSLRPLPDKWHGLTATDTRYRQREIDLLANPDSRRCSTPGSRPSPPSAGSWYPRTSWKWTPRSSNRRPAGPWPGRS